MFSSQDEHFMRRAIEAARTGIENGQSPFGAALVRHGDLVLATHNHVWSNTDITAHAEIHCLRLGCRELGTIDLSGCTIYSTTEPCPMCFSAIHWAKCERIVYGTNIQDAMEAGFSELTISNTQMKQLGGSPVQVEDGCLRAECQELFALWTASPDHRAY